MSYLRSYLPNCVGNLLGYYYGKSIQLSQQFISPPFEIIPIVDNIYIGNIASTIYLEQLKENGITHILSIYNGGYETYPNDFKYKIIHINDDPWLSLDQYFDECIDFILDSQKTHGKILIHCMCGVSRSATIISAYLIKIHKIPVQNTIEFMKNKKSNIEPNQGFILQLYNYEKKYKLTF